MAISKNDRLIAARILDEPRIHSARLVPLIDEVVRAAGYRMADVQAVAVSRGPGSFTGLRIGVSTAKGIAFGLGIALVGVPTFEALAQANVGLVDEGETLVTASPSRRNEAYVQFWEVVGTSAVALSEPQSLTFEELAQAASGFDTRLVLVGEGAGLLDARRPEPSTLKPAVYGVVELGGARLARGEVEDVESFEPFYLKEFVAKKGGSPFDRLKF